MRESSARPREFSDGNGVRWRVGEAEPAGHARALYFETDYAFRRVTNGGRSHGDRRVFAMQLRP